MKTSVILLALGLGTSLAGQAQEKPVFRASTDIVRLDVLATSHGRPVAGLTADDFEVKDKGVRQHVELSTTVDRVSVVMLLSLSSVAQRDLAAACRALAGVLRPDDTAWVVAYGLQFSVIAGPTNDGSLIPCVTTQFPRQNGASLWDALFGSVSLVTGMNGRSLVVAFTSGGDGSSWLDEDRIMETLKRSEVVVEGVIPRGVIPDIYPIERAARLTGGTVLTADPTAKLTDQFARVVNEFRLGYVLTYKPTGVRTDDGWHNVSVRVVGRDANTRVRPGYFAKGG